jgi:opacity protein-like surface antigen
MRSPSWFIVFATCSLMLGGIAMPRDARADRVEEIFGGFYLGGGVGWADIRIPGRSFTMEGIDFSKITASEDNAGYRVFAGYWITGHVGFAVGAYMLGNVRASFNYFDPPAESGTGETKVTLYGNPLTLQVGGDLGPVRLFASGGTLFWRSEYDTRFYLPGGETQSRTLRRTGTSLAYGLGASWNIRGNWNLRVDAEMMKIDVADIKTVTVGLEYRLKN